jgi:hypothetical protein
VQDPHKGGLYTSLEAPRVETSLVGVLHERTNEKALIPLDFLEGTRACFMYAPAVPPRLSFFSQFNLAPGIALTGNTRYLLHCR